MNETEELLAKILGEEAMDNCLSMQIPKNISKLAKSVNYLATQIKIVKNYSDDDNIKEHVDSVLSSLNNILRDAE